MKRNIILFAAAIGAAFISVSCAREVSVNDNESEKLFLEGWTKIHYPEATQTELGTYILEDEPGTGTEIVSGINGYAYAVYTLTDTDGTVSSTNDEKVAKRIGTWAAKTYYGPSFLGMGEDVLTISYAGIEDMLIGMKIGGRRKALIPSWLLTQNRYSDNSNYFKNSTSQSSIICDLTLYDVVEDIYSWQAAEMTKYSNLHLNGVDSTHYAGNEEYGKFGFYFYSREVEADALVPGDDSTVYINYTGRLLSGKVFDTTIADTAKVHGIYSASKTYEPQEVDYAESYSDITLADGSAIDGFQMGLKMMHAGEKATIMFYSDLGYGVSGSGTAIPAFAPLVFEIDMVPDPNED